MTNKKYIKLLSLFLLALLVISIADFDTKKTKNTAGVISSIINFFSLDDGVSDCTEGDVDLQCPLDVGAGCYCNGGVSGSNQKIWQDIGETPLLRYSDAENYCKNLGPNWRIPSLEELFSIYNYDMNYIYTDIQPSKPIWFKPDDTIFWTNYKKDSLNTFMVINYNSFGVVKNTNQVFSTICVKDLYTVDLLPIYITNLYFEEDVPSMPEINEEKGTIVFRVPHDYYNVDLTPVIGFNRDLDMGESVTPSSGEKQNFSSPITYTITLVDGRTKSYVVSVERQERPIGSESQIIDLAVKQAMYNVNIDETNKEITIGVSAALDMSNLVYIVRVSNGATLNTSSGYVAFNDGYSGYAEHQYVVSNQSPSTTYTVTSEDGKSVTVYKVSLAYPPTVSITADPITVLEGKTTKITWTPIGAKTCEAISPDTGYDANWPGSLSAIDGGHTWTTKALNLNSYNKYVYQVVCSNDSGSTDIKTQIVKVLPDIYPEKPDQKPVAGLSGRMSDVLKQANVSLLDNEMMYLIKRESYYNYRLKTQIAHTVTCPVGTDYRVCVEDNNDGRNNYVLIGVK